MSVVTSFPKHRSHGPSVRQLQAARRRMTRGRNLDRLAWRYRYALRVLQSLGLTVIVLGGVDVASRLMGAR